MGSSVSNSLSREKLDLQGLLFFFFFKFVYLPTGFFSLSKLMIYFLADSLVEIPLLIAFKFIFSL